jgi:23S rRNA (guanine745-N1)-methyltransferase
LLEATSPPSTPTLYHCPVCQQGLSAIANHLICEKKHSFDRHKKGYVNLLMSHHKNSKAPGDNSEMVHGRREFLRAGHYQTFADAVVKMASQCQQSDDPLQIVDAGCGEGFYTDQLQANIISSVVYGFDISKPAIAAAASNKSIEWSVASSNRPPFIHNNIDLIVSIFSRVEREAFLKILAPQGYVLYAGPGDQHLQALRHIIYDQVNDYSSDKHQDYFGEDFDLIAQQSLQVPIHLDNNTSIKQLLSMTPHAHRVSKAGWTRLEKTHSLSDSGDFKLYLYQKRH